jgi:hypothetical protein
MSNIPNQRGGSASSSADGGVDNRVFRVMVAVTAVAVIGSLPVAEWRVSAGLLLGGLLSLLNHRWLRNSVFAAFAVAIHGAKPQITLTQYILRYFVIGISVFAAYKLNIVSLTATLVGLCSFVMALLAEALREFYFAIIHREEIN